MIVSIFLAIAGALVSAPGSTADSAPVDPGDPKTPVTVTADSLHTAQHDGVAWQAAVIGNTVYVAGKFNNARPFGAAPGTQLLARRNILAFDLTTGQLIPGFAPVWAVTGNNSYVVMVGEFRNVNQQPQQGLSRFAHKEAAPNLQGPRVTGEGFVPALSSPGAGEVHVQWQSNWDRDNSNLTYSVLRDGSPDPVYSSSAESTFWQRPTLTFNDSGLAAGQHSYQMSVRDPLGNTVAGASRSITVAGSSNSPPVASFSASTNLLAVGVDAAASSDPDGTISSYAWTFGDGGTGTGVTAAHSYAAEGTYTIVLTVTDDGGVTGVTSRTVTITSGGVLAQDAFARTRAAGRGPADTGGAWSVNGSATFYSVAGGQDVMSLAAGRGPSGYLAGISTTASNSVVTVSLDKIGNGGGSYLGVVGRRVGTAEYRGKVKVAANGAATIQLTRLSGGAETTLVQSASGITLTAGQQLRLRVEVTGTAPTSLRAKAWRIGTAEPGAWAETATDATSGLQGAGSAGLLSYLSGTATNAPVQARFDDRSTAQLRGPEKCGGTWKSMERQRS